MTVKIRLSILMALVSVVITHWPAPVHGRTIGERDEPRTDQAQTQTPVQFCHDRLLWKMRDVCRNGGFHTPEAENTQSKLLIPIFQLPLCSGAYFTVDFIRTHNSAHMFSCRIILNSESWTTYLACSLVPRFDILYNECRIPNSPEVLYRRQISRHLAQIVLILVVCFYLTIFFWSDLALISGFSDTYVFFQDYVFSSISFALNKGSHLVRG